MVKSFQTRVLFILALTCLALPPLAGLAAAKPALKANPRNVIVLIADGCGSEHYTLARWFKGTPLTLDALLVGGVRTFIADSVIADSAPTGTAYATGYRTSDKLIGLGPKPGTIAGVSEPATEMQFKPLATVLEGAKLKGMATGIVATSRITHATPAAYISHVASRSQEDLIMEQAVYQDIDVIMGGGGQYLLPKAADGKRTDGEDLRSVLRSKGYVLAQTRDAMAAFKTGRLFGMFSGSHMEPEIDRLEFAPQQPSLEEMTRKAIDILSRKPGNNGFFLMVEGSQIDWANHANDPAHLISDMLQYDGAVKAALDFAKQDGKTLVLALSDHNTGGMSIGNYGTSKTYSQMKPDQLLDPIRKMKLSAPGLLRKVGNDKTPEKVKEAVKNYWAMTISDDEAAAILAIAKRDPEDPQNGFGEVLSPKYTAIGWSTHGHTGGDVPLFAYGPQSPKGLLDGPEIGRVTADALGLDLDRLNGRLFVEAQKAFPEGRVTMDKQDAENPILKISYGNRNAELPINKNILRLDGADRELEGVVVYIAETDRAYLPLQAVQAIKGVKTALPAVGK
ncbi:MAG: alkaline phosphatase [Deltaproteobacteria bacterium]|nr:alkaline phosphatase [Deltaproteobacteria bacterium]